MTTSGSYAFDPSFATLLDEAAERAGIDPATLTSRHISSAKTSINLMLTQWSALDGDALYRMASASATVVSGTNNFTLATGTLDLLDIVLDYSSDDRDMAIARISRQDYLNIADKTQTGKPSQFYVDFSTLNTPKVYLWPVPDATCVFTYDYMRYPQTLGAISETMDVHRPWLEAVASGLALRLAEKYNPPRVQYLSGSAKESYMIARRAGGGNAQIVVSARGFGRSGRTRRFV